MGANKREQFVIDVAEFLYEVTSDEAQISDGDIVQVVQSDMWTSFEDAHHNTWMDMFTSMTLGNAKRKATLIEGIRTEYRRIVREMNAPEPDTGAHVTRDALHIDMTLVSPVTYDDDGDMDQATCDAIVEAGGNVYRTVIETMTINETDVSSTDAYKIDVMEGINTGEAHDVTPFWANDRTVACIVFYPHPNT